MLPPAGVVLLLLAWGTLVAVDLVSWPQAMLSRPVVAGAVAGWITGDLEAGFRIGVLLELFALDVLPVGAARYPDYGPATVAAVLAASGAAWPERTGLSVLLALFLAVLGGWSMQRLRMANASAMQARAAALAAGSPGALIALHWGGLARDVVRGLTLMVLGIAMALVVRALPPLSARWEAISAAVAVGGAIMAVVGGAWRSAGRGRRLAWLAVGLACGVAIAMTRAAS